MKERNIYLTMHSAHFIYDYITQAYAKGPFKQRGNPLPHIMGYSFQVAARAVLYAPSHR